MNWRRKIAFSPALFLIALLPAAALAEDTTVAVPTLSLTFAPTYIAEDLGIWKRLGLNVKLHNIAGVGATSAVISGSVDFANTTAGAFIRAAARGQRLLAIANTLDRPMMEIVLAKSAASGISPSADTATKIRALKGRTIAVDAINSITHGYLKYAARKAGLDADKDIVVTPLQPPSMLAALQSGAIDGFAMSQPWTLMAVENQSAMVLASSPRGDFPDLNPFAYNLIITRKGLCEQSPNTCRNLVKGYAEALSFMREHPAESVELLQKRFPQLPPPILKASFQIMLSGVPATAAVDPVGLDKAQDYSIGAGLLDASEKQASFADLFTLKYLPEPNKP